MSPIRPEHRDRYPAHWAGLAAEIKHYRAEDRCECRGECGSPRCGAAQGLVERCEAVHRHPSPNTGSVVVLTVAHLDHTPENCDPDNLRALCQLCHLAYDHDHHVQTRRRMRTYG